TGDWLRVSNFRWICRFADYSSANSELSQSKCLTQAVFIGRSLARIVHCDMWGLKSYAVRAEVGHGLSNR
ncbi:MAG: hypothetical protein WA437_13825, partial [Candidatus Sulfotelmatobacter sp.]